MSKSEKIHTFWVGPATMYGCNECQMAGASEEEINHDEDCSLHSSTNN